MRDDTDLGPVLLTLARAAIGTEFGLAASKLPAHGALAARGATFVTLRMDGALRGCIGTVQAWRPLADDLRANAIAAAFADPRFPPLARSEFSAIAIEVSLLSPSMPLAAADEDGALAQLRPGVDGVVLERGAQRATFLPQVWEQLPEPRAFLAELKRKAGLPAEFWSEELRLSRYAVVKFSESCIAFSGAPP